jgi:hypothetical protein
MQYYGVPLNYHALRAFRDAITRLWHQALTRRSQKGDVPWKRMHRLAVTWLPPARIQHPYPSDRLGVTTRGKSPVR